MRRSMERSISRASGKDGRSCPEKLMLRPRRGANPRDRSPTPDGVWGTAAPLVRTWASINVFHLDTGPNRVGLPPPSRAFRPRLLGRFQERLNVYSSGVHERVSHHDYRDWGADPDEARP